MRMATVTMSSVSGPLPTLPLSREQIPSSDMWTVRRKCSRSPRLLVRNSTDVGTTSLTIWPVKWQLQQVSCLLWTNNHEALLVHIWHTSSSRSISNVLLLSYFYCVQRQSYTIFTVGNCETGLQTSFKTTRLQWQCTNECTAAVPQKQRQSTDNYIITLRRVKETTNGKLNLQNELNVEMQKKTSHGIQEEKCRH